MTPFQSARLPGRSAAAFLALCLIAATVAAAASTELDWARNALARNGALEVISTDRADGTITVRVKSTGELRTLRADQVIAEPPPALGSTGSTPAAARGGRVIASGPGYSISAVGTGSGAATEAANVSDAEAARNLPVEHRHEPLVCQGARLLHIDNRNLVFDGDAVSVEDGCELHITNSSITAHGIGIAARGASVHIDNSIVEGRGGAVDASDNAQVYARSSVFRGLIRRNDTSAFHDLGGNVGN